ncbi:hypothetical protein EX895_001322 [Sporisorium graminicola]|uniref:Leucine-rich repeat-containing N-terminal plant-type domain-containing protein n=1 Tax=Sporisorium graminicola TaxID=280036 RepID=A0A4U7KZ20_9BASI|nr:hypothetical protein EX895_001322 [Sporisorium graminicola]TKY89537.1 hypothetical protein EX895_001322 [Sporisorium graminicola]
MEPVSPLASSSSSSKLDSASTPAQSRSPIVLSEAWKQLHLSSPSFSSHTPGSSSSASALQLGSHSHSKHEVNDDDADSSDDGFLSDHSEELHPETGFDPFLTATRRARQHSTSSNLTPQPAASTISPTAGVSASDSSPASSNEVVATSEALRKQHRDDDDEAKQQAYRWSRIAKYWSKVVDEVIFQPKQGSKQGMIDLSDRNITDILPTIADLSRFVALPPPRYDRDDSPERASPEPQSLLQSKTGGLVRHESYLAPFSAHIHNDSASSRTNNVSTKRTLSRSQSAFQPSLSRAQSFARTQSAMSTLSSRSAGSYRDHRDRQATLSIFLGSNALTRLPSALFQLQNLRVLSLRSNKLKFLPPAIGDLHNLSELHIAHNELQYLPAEILRLKLDVFTWFPNPYFVKPPKTGVLTVRPLLCHRAARIRQQHSLNKLAELNDIDETDDASSMTPVRAEHNSVGDDDAFIPMSQQPPPLIRAPAPSSARDQRQFDRTRSEMQVEGFLARGIDQLRGGSYASISEQDHEADGSSDDANTTADETDAGDNTVNAEAAPSESEPTTEDEQERQRQRILEAAFDEDTANLFDLTPSTEQDASSRGKVAGRSRVLGSKTVSGLPSLRELCIRKLLSPYDVSEAEAQGIASPFLSPIVQTSGGPLRRRSSNASRSSSRNGTPLFEAQLRNRTASFGSNASRTRSFSSNGGPEDSKFGKRVPTLLEAYENGTLQSLVGELGHGLIPLLEAARRSATQDWGTRARMRSNSTVAAKRNGWARTQSAVDAFPASEANANANAAQVSRGKVPASHDEQDDSYDVFGGVEVPGSLDRGDDACTNPWFSRCPNPKHCEEGSRESQSSQGVKRTGDIALHRGKRGFGSTSSVSSLGTTLGGGAKAETGSIDMERVPSTAASSDSGAAPASPLSSSASSSVGTVAGFGSLSTSSMPSRPESQISGSGSSSMPFSGQQVRFAPHSQRSFTSSGLSGRTWPSSRPAMGADRVGLTRPASTQFVRGFSSSSALSASGLHRSTSSGPGWGEEAAERDWPLSEQEHRQAPVFSDAGETRLEWISHIGGIRVAKLGEAQVELEEDLNSSSASAAVAAEAAEGGAASSQHPSLLGAMGGFENKDLLPILWRGCSRGCLDFLV